VPAALRAAAHINSFSDGAIVLFVARGGAGRSRNVKETGNYIKLFDDTIAALFRDGVRTTLRRPAQAGFFMKTLWRQRKAARARKRWEGRGVHVPPIMILSVTNRCNLNCKGCYARELRPQAGAGGEMSREEWESVVGEASELGVGIIMIAGGEPLLRREILDVAADFPEILFPVFTNGLMIDDGMLAWLRKNRNVIPVVSLEGDAWETDSRRGREVYGRVRDVASRLGRGRIFYGVSVTVTGSTFRVVTDETFPRELADAGCGVFFFVEYVPMGEDTGEPALTPEQKTALLESLERFRAEYPALFVAFPGDEEQFGGCLAAGRGFVHVNAAGDVEACPFAPYADVNLRRMSLGEALASPLLGEIRRNHHMLTETRGGCALWANREWVRSLLAEGTPGEGR
jgi:MoaA/NifB/PqqE/SkfB family radical SAM enzyme